MADKKGTDEASASATPEKLPPLTWLNILSIVLILAGIALCVYLAYYLIATVLGYVFWIIGLILNYFLHGSTIITEPIPPMYMRVFWVLSSTFGCYVAQELLAEYLIPSLRTDGYSPNTPSRLIAIVRLFTTSRSKRATVNRSTPQSSTRRGKHRS
eukprot:m.189889 g.189889  ORF g.189889 m.189889 type:complete len:156 (-) comp32388_c2_seq10:957-1424(-)